MLPSSRRLSIPLFKSVVDKGKLFHSPFFSAKMMRAEGPSRFSVVVSKKVAKNATDRNKIRRRMYSALIPFCKNVSGVHGVIMLKKEVIKASSDQISFELGVFFVKIGLMK